MKFSLFFYRYLQGTSLESLDEIGSATLEQGHTQQLQTSKSIKIEMRMGRIARRTVERWTVEIFNWCPHGSRGMETSSNNNKVD